MTPDKGFQSSRREAKKKPKSNQKLLREMKSFINREIINVPTDKCGRKSSTSSSRELSTGVSVEELTKALLTTSLAMPDETSEESSTTMMATVKTSHEMPVEISEEMEPSPSSMEEISSTVSLPPILSPDCSSEDSSPLSANSELASPVENLTVVSGSSSNDVSNFVPSYHLFPPLAFSSSPLNTDDPNYHQIFIDRLALEMNTHRLRLANISEETTRSRSKHGLPAIFNFRYSSPPGIDGSIFAKQSPEGQKAVLRQKIEEKCRWLCQLVSSSYQEYLKDDMSSLDTTLQSLNESTVLYRQFLSTG